MNIPWVKRAVELFRLPPQPSESTTARQSRMEVHPPRGALTDLCVIDRKVRCETTGEVFRPWLWVWIDQTSGAVIAWQILGPEISAVLISHPALPRAIRGRMELQFHRFNQIALALPGEPPSVADLAAAASEFFGTEQGQG